MHGYANGLITLVEASPQGYRERSKFMQSDRQSCRRGPTRF